MKEVAGLLLVVLGPVAGLAAAGSALSRTSPGTDEGDRDCDDGGGSGSGDDTTSKHS